MKQAMINEIYQEADLNEKEIAQMPFHLENGDDFIFSSAYEKLFNYFCDTGEMPYGTAKARDGDPDVWILEELESRLV